MASPLMRRASLLLLCVGCSSAPKDACPGGFAGQSTCPVPSASGSSSSTQGEAPCLNFAGDFYGESLQIRITQKGCDLGGQGRFHAHDVQLTGTARGNDGILRVAVVGCSNVMRILLSGSSLMLQDNSSGCPFFWLDPWRLTRSPLHDPDAPTAKPCELEAGRFYNVKSALSGLCLDAYAGDPTDGGLVVQATCHEGQRWRFEPAEDGSFQVISSIGTNQCLGAADASSSVIGEGLVHTTCTPAQRWRLLQSATPGHCYVESMSSGLCLGVMMDADQPPPGIQTVGLRTHQLLCRPEYVWSLY